jgi:hypothetical protein
MLSLVAVVAGGYFSLRVRDTRPPPTYAKFNICDSVFRSHAHLANEAYASQCVENNLRFERMQHCSIVSSNWGIKIPYTQPWYR